MATISIHISFVSSEGGSAVSLIPQRGQLPCGARQNLSVKAL